MLRRNDGCPVDYRMCRQTVTVYHREDDRFTRRVHDRAWMDFRKTQTVDKTGSREVNTFLLVIPCTEQAVFVGDKVMLGIGPEVVSWEDWEGLIPSNYPGLVTVRSADPKYWGTQMVHVEAGG